jgi:hypothetical protein
MNTVQAIIHDDILTNSRLAKFEDYSAYCDKEFNYNSASDFCEETKLCTIQELKDYIEQMNTYAKEFNDYDVEGNLILEPK